MGGLERRLWLEVDSGGASTWGGGDRIRGRRGVWCVGALWKTGEQYAQAVAEFHGPAFEWHDSGRATNAGANERRRPEMGGRAQCLSSRCPNRRRLRRSLQGGPVRRQAENARWLQDPGAQPSDD